MPSQVIAWVLDGGLHGLVEDNGTVYACTIADRYIQCCECGQPACVHTLLTFLAYVDRDRA